MSPLLFTADELDDHPLLGAEEVESREVRELSGRDRVARQARYRRGGQAKQFNGAHLKRGSKHGRWRRHAR